MTAADLDSDAWVFLPLLNFHFGAALGNENAVGLISLDLDHTAIFTFGSMVFY
jgi:hypothetical protein